jgi:protein-tyrosine phosphatase
MFRRIIVVCTGNICRSPLAEAMLRQRFSSSEVEICSAGIAALVNHPADPMAQQLAAENGLDISAHRARQATQEMLTSMDLILTMDQTHNTWIGSRFPQLQGRTYKIGRWRKNFDVADPFRKPKQAFQQAFNDINLCIEDWAPRLGLD